LVSIHATADVTADSFFGGASLGLGDLANLPTRIINQVLIGVPTLQVWLMNVDEFPRFLADKHVA